MMSKVKLYKVLHVERFMNLIEECKGRVLWHLCGDTAVDLHRDGSAMDMIRKEAAEGNGVELSFSDSGDYCRFVFFMLGR